MNPAQLLEHFDRISEAPDAVARLRRFILDLAVRGKLVEQEPSDEPAAELLKHIGKERVFATKNGLLKPIANIPISPKPQSWQLPSSWMVVPLPLAVYFQEGPGLRNWQFRESGVPFLNIRTLQGGRVQRELCQYVDPEEVATKYPHFLLRAGDIVCSTSGTIGKLALVRESDLPLMLNTSIVRFCAYGAAGPVIGFIRLFLQTDTFLDQAKASVTGAAQVNMGPVHLKAMAFPLPPLAEQHRIIAKVDELMALCDQLEAAKSEREARRDRLVAASLHRIGTAPAAADEAATEAQSATPLRDAARFHLDHLPRLTTRREHIKQLRQTILNLAIRGRLVPQDPNDEPAAELLKRIQDWRNEAIEQKQIRAPKKTLKPVEVCEIPYHLPTGWEWARLGEIIYIRSGDGLTAANMKDGVIPVFGGNGINGHHNAHNVDEPTIVIGRVGYYCGSIHLTPSKAWVTDNAFVTLYCQKAIYQGFLLLLLKGTDLKESEKATAQPVISGSKIYPLVVGLPPLAEQHRIVAKVDALMALCDQLEAQLTATQTDSRRLLDAVLHVALAAAA